jgi:hypothetical protein
VPQRRGTWWPLNSASQGSENSVKIMKLTPSNPASPNLWASRFCLLDSTSP